LAVDQALASQLLFRRALGHGCGSGLLNGGELICSQPCDGTILHTLPVLSLSRLRLEH